MKDEFRQNKQRYGQILVMIALSTVIICLIILAFFVPETFSNVLNAVVTLLTPFIWGMGIAYLLHPMCVHIEAWLRMIGKKGKAEKAGGKGGWQRIAAALLSLVILLVIVTIVLLLILPQLISSVSSIISSLPDAAETFQEWLDKLAKGDTSTAVTGYIGDTVNTITAKLEEFLETSILPGMQSALSNVTSSFMNIIGVLANFGLGCIISVYFLCGWEQFIAQGKLVLYCIFPKKGADWIWEELRFADRMFSGFIVGKIVDSFIMGVLCFIFSALFRFPYAALISVLIGVTNVIPFFGPYLGSIPSVFLILTVSLPKAVGFLIFIIILQQVDGNIIGPKIIGNKLGISSFWVLFSILFFGSLWGLVGMLIGAPTFAVLYDLITRGVTRGLEKRGQKKMHQKYIETYHEEEQRD